VRHRRETRKGPERIERRHARMKVGIGIVKRKKMRKMNFCRIPSMTYRRRRMRRNG
jgi:hypothetical protein